MSDAPLLSLIRPWRTEERGVLLETPIFTIRSRRCTSATEPSRGGEFYYMDSADWVNVVALTPDRQVVMIEQFRYGSLEVTLELPGGIVDPGEDAMAAGARELREETGYAGDPPEALGFVSPNPAIQNNRCHTGLIRNARLAGEQEPDPNEEIAVRLVPLDQIPALVRDGTIHHAMVVSALHHLSLAGI